MNIKGPNINNEFLKACTIKMIGIQCDKEKIKSGCGELLEVKKLGLKK